MGTDRNFSKVLLINTRLGFYRKILYLMDCWISCHMLSQIQLNMFVPVPEKVWDLKTAENTSELILLKF